MIGIEKNHIISAFNSHYLYLLKKQMKSNAYLNNKVVNNFKDVKYTSLILPISILAFIFFYFLLNHSGNSYRATYINAQENLFYYLNNNLSQLPDLQLNITQLGDVLVFLSFVSIFIIYAPKLWESLLASSLISLVISFILKNFFDMPRPVKRLDLDQIVIVGERHSGYSSLPSGHSITIFVVFTILLFAFMPQKKTFKISWSLLIILLGLFIAFSRVAIGAHYPIDVIVGSIIGFSSSVLGIKLCNKKNWFSWINNKKVYPLLIAFFPIWMFIIAQKAYKNNLIIFYFSIISLVITLYLLTKPYVKKRN